MLVPGELDDDGADLIHDDHEDIDDDDDQRGNDQE